MSRWPLGLGLLFLLACGTADYNSGSANKISTGGERQRLAALLGTYGQLVPPQGRQAYILVMEGGCGGCVAVTQRFIKQNIDLPGLVVVVSIRSRKSVNLSFGADVRQRPNFLRDSLEQAFDLGLLEGQHPKYILCENGKLVEAENIVYTTAEAQFAKIKAFLSLSAPVPP
jgi:hypothetical protein